MSVHMHSVVFESIDGLGVSVRQQAKGECGVL